MITRIALISAVAFCGILSIWGQVSNPTPQPLPFSQDFSELLHSSKKYPPGFMGWRVRAGQLSELFETIAYSDTFGLIANSYATNTSGGVHNYDQKIGFQYTSSHFPSLALAINTNGKTNIQVQYKISTIRNPYDAQWNTRILEATLQYRVGEDGEFTTLYGIEYITNEKQYTAGNSHRNQQTRVISLPTDCDNQPIVQLRWIARIISGVGYFPSLAIDDIVIDGTSITLPVLLTSFSVELDSHHRPLLTWVTQSESNMLGYRIYRGEDERIGNARLISALVEACNSSQQQIYCHLDEEELAAGDYWYWIESLDLDGSNMFFGPIVLDIDDAGTNSAPPIPLKTALGRPYPNPFNPRTQIPYSLHKDAETSFGIYNLKGQRIWSFPSEYKAAGSYKLDWNGRDDRGEECASGMYWIVMEAGKQRFVEKLVMMK